MVRYLFIFLGCIGLLAYVQTLSKRPSGIVEGVVLDEHGLPLAGATVYVATVPNPPQTLTDNFGRFVLKGVPAGFDVGLSAYKIKDGYPYNFFSFFQVPGERAPHVELSADLTIQGIMIQLGARAAYLNINITDESGEPVNAGLTFSRPDVAQERPDTPGFGDYGTTVLAKDMILVPPMPFRLTVEAAGYESWHYGGTNWQSDKGLIKLKSGETLTIAVTLRHTRKSANSEIP